MEKLKEYYCFSDFNQTCEINDIDDISRIVFPKGTTKETRKQLQNIYGADVFDHTFKYDNKNIMVVYIVTKHEDYSMPEWECLNDYEYTLNNIKEEFKKKYL